MTFAVLLLALAADTRSEAKAEPTTVRLSDAVRVTLTVEGDAPLVVDVPADVLDEASAAVWLVRPAGDATLSAPANGRQTWRQVYRATPFVPGKDLGLEFAPFRATANGVTRDVRWKRFDIRVETSVTDLNGGDIRPVTGIEETIVPPDPAEPPVALILGGIVVVVFAVAAIGVRLRKRPAPTLPPAAWADRELAALADPSVPAAAFAARLGDVLRGFAERRAGVPAAARTTAELLAALEPAGVWPADALADLRAALDRCDRAKFAGDLPTAEERESLTAAARRFVSGG